MKKIYLLILLFFIALPAKVFAQEQGYIIKATPKSVSLFSCKEENNHLYDDWYYVSEKDIANYDISYIEPDYNVSLLALPTDPLYSSQWSLEMINASASYETGCFGNDVRVAVIDSGIYMHSDIKNNILAGYNYLSNSTDVTDEVGHGTAVSGIIAAEYNNIGVASLAGKAKIVPLKCFDSENSSLSYIIRAIIDAVDVFNCHVINLSVGTSAQSLALEAVVNYAISQGAIVVSAVGNDGTDVIYYPAAYSNVIGVGSVDSSAVISYFSQRNNSVSVVAPGQKVNVLNLSDGYRKASGTSYSCPFVSALAAVAKSIDPDITSVKFKSLLESTATDLGSKGYDTSYGNGLINVSAFITELLKDKKLFVSPINIIGNTATISVIDNNDKNYDLYFAFYDEDKIIKVKKFTTDKSGAYDIPLPVAAYAKAMLWQKDTLSPVALRYHNLT